MEPAVEQPRVRVDEHGEVFRAPDVPRWVTTEAELERWDLCVARSLEVIGGAQEQRFDPFVTAMALNLYRSNIPTRDPGPAPAKPAPGEQHTLTEGILTGLQRLYDEAKHPRNRLGRWVDVPAPIVRARHAHAARVKQSPGVARGHGKRSPGVSLAEIRAAGLDEWPEKGAAAQRILGDAASTAELHATAMPGQRLHDPHAQRIYDHERAARHRAIIDEYLAGKTPDPSGKKYALFTAGGPASGKSTTLRQNPQLAPDPEHTVHIDADKLKEALPEYQELRDAGEHYAALAVHLESGDLAYELQQEAMARGLNIIVDGTGDSEPGSFAAILRDANDRGYVVDVLYVNTPTDTAVASAVERAEETGRYVPVPVIRDQHARVSRNFMTDVLNLDFLGALDIYDDDGLVATLADDGGLDVREQERYDEFLRKAFELATDAPMPEPPASPGV